MARDGEHQLRSKRLPTRYCGDHYCTGHSRTVYTCACGADIWEGEYSYGSGPDIEQMFLRHVLEAEGFIKGRGD